MLHAVQLPPLPTESAAAPELLMKRADLTPMLPPTPVVLSWLLAPRVRDPAVFKMMFPLALMPVKPLTDPNARLLVVLSVRFATPKAEPARPAAIKAIVFDPCVNEKLALAPSVPTKLIW